jgi:capsular exopolysaccharide synthesis family protein
MMNADQNGLVDPRYHPLATVPRDAAVLMPDFALETDNADVFDVRKIWSAVWRNRLLILAIVAASLVLGVLSLFLSNPTYRATASVEINNQPVKVLGTEDNQQNSSPQETDRLLQTQIDILKSRSLAERVAADLNLAADDAFLKAQGVSPKAGRRREQVIKAVGEGLVVSLPHNSRVVPVSFDSSDRVLAAKVANRYVENLIAGNLQRHFDSSSYSKGFLQNQLGVTKARLEQSERALLDYARSVGLVDPSAGGGDPDSPGNNAPRSLTSANLIDINQSLAAAKAARMQAEGRWRQAAGTPVMNLPEVLSNPAIQQMTQKRAELQSQYQEELQHRKADHPAVQQAAAAIRELDRQIATLAGSIRNSIHNQFRVAQNQEAELASSVGNLKGATLREQQLGVRYNILKREVDTNRELYDGLLQRYKEVSAEAGVTSNNISVVDRAEPPMLPISPRPLVNLTLAAILGVLLAAGAVAAKEIFRDGVRDPDEVEQRFGVPLLGHVPLISGDSKASDEIRRPDSNVSEAYQAVRAAIELSSDAGYPRTLLVTSSRAGEGKSTTALAMAREVAASGRKVLLIDADMRRPTLHDEIGVSREPGLSNFLTQQLAIEAVISETDTPGLSFIPAGARPPSPAELVGGNGIRAMLSFLREEYDQIIIDSPPVLGLADAPRLSSLVDGTMLIIEANRSQVGAIDNAVRRLKAARANLIGAVLVKFDARKADFGSNYLLDYYDYSDWKGAAQAAS